jgi:hypothetical protein
MSFGHPSNKLRFIERDGKRVLQQEWLLPIVIPEDFDMELVMKGLPTEWRDVPFVANETSLDDEALSK